jgi:hypothetical protein
MATIIAGRLGFFVPPSLGRRGVPAPHAVRSIAKAGVAAGSVGRLRLACIHTVRRPIPRCRFRGAGDRAEPRRAGSRHNLVRATIRAEVRYVRNGHLAGRRSGRRMRACAVANSPHSLCTMIDVDAASAASWDAKGSIDRLDAATGGPQLHKLPACTRSSMLRAPHPH